MKKQNYTAYDLFWSMINANAQHQYGAIQPIKEKMANLLVEGRCKVVLNLQGVGTLEFIGISKAACGTSIAIPQLKIQLDAGNNVYNFHPDAVFITHCHSDHCYGVTYFLSRDKPPLFFMPVSMVERLEDYLLECLRKKE